MFKTNYIFGTGDTHVKTICLDHINNTMMILVNEYQKSFYDWIDSYGTCNTTHTFGKFLESVTPKAITKDTDRVFLYESLLHLLENPEEQELSIEQEYMLFNIIDCYIELSGLKTIDYQTQKPTKIESNPFDFSRVIVPNIWYIENNFSRNLVINDMKIAAKEIMKDLEDVDDNINGESIEDLVQDLMSCIEDITKYRDLLDDIDFELFDKIPNIRSI